VKFVTLLIVIRLKVLFCSCKEQRRYPPHDVSSTAACIVATRNTSTIEGIEAQ
jgi:hypothetical protein